jgi:glycosyltransferase involved in cell wall biosynthesis
VTNSLPETLSAVGEAVLPYRLNDPTDLAAKLQCVLDRPELAEQYRRRACAKAEAEYNWQRVTDQHEAVYRSVWKQDARLLPRAR